RWRQKKSALHGRLASSPLRKSPVFSTSIFLRSPTGSASLDWRQNRLTCRLGKLGRKRGARFPSRAREWKELPPETIALALQAQCAVRGGLGLGRPLLASRPLSTCDTCDTCALRLALA